MPLIPVSHLGFPLGEMRVLLILHFLTEQLEFITVAKQYIESRRRPGLPYVEEHPSKAKRRAPTCLQTT